MLTPLVADAAGVEQSAIWKVKTNEMTPDSTHNAQTAGFQSSEFKADNAVMCGIRFVSGGLAANACYAVL